MSTEFNGDEKSAAAAEAAVEGGQNPDSVTQLANRLFAAEQSTNTELKMTLWEALRLYPMASMWSLLISFAVVMEGMVVETEDQYLGHEEE